MDRRRLMLVVTTITLVLSLLVACQPSTPEPTAVPTPEAEEEATEEAPEAEPIRLGVLAPLSGAFAGLGEDGVAGVEIALEELDYTIAGRPVELHIEDTQIEPDVAVEKARALVNRDDVHFIVGPLSGSTSLAVKEAAFEWQDVTVFPNGAANDITMREIAPNVYRTAFAGGQPLYALAEWAIENDITSIATIGEDYSFPWDQIGGFAYVYCQLGGSIPEAYWTPIGTSDYSSIMSDLDPNEIQAVLVAYGGTDAVNFVNQMNDFGLLDQIDLLGGSSFADASVLAEVGNLMEGTVSGSLYSTSLDTPEFRDFDQKFREKMGGRASSLFAENYYRGVKWIALTTEAVDGNIEDVEAWRDQLEETEFNAPAGHVQFDEYQNVVQDMYLNRVVCTEEECTNEVFEVIPEVGQYWTFEPEEFNEALPFGRENPSCP